MSGNTTIRDNGSPQARGEKTPEGSARRVGVAVLPSDTPTGRHDLVVSGVDDSQRPHRVATTIDIRGTTHWWMHGLLGTAGACVLFTGVSRLNLQRLRRTTEPRQPRAVRR